jgi:hypothetical protein
VKFQALHVNLATNLTVQNIAKYDGQSIDFKLESGERHFEKEKKTIYGGGCCVYEDKK